MDEEHIRFEAFWQAYKPKGFVGFSRDADGKYHTEFLRDALELWKVAYEFGLKDSKRRTQPSRKALQNEKYFLPLKERIELESTPVPESGCWLWTDRVNNSGYGMISIPVDFRLVRMLAHRISYESHKGPIPEDKRVLHTCDVRCCVNPEHLWLGTIAENNKDRKEKGRNNSARGIRLGSAKLTEDAVRAIRADNRYAPQVAKDHGVSASAINCVRNGKTWGHVV